MTSVHLLCAMPVVREEYDREGLTGNLTVATCGEPIALETQGYKYLDADGTTDGPTAWKVACHAGHVLCMDDDEGNGRAIHFEWKMVGPALEPFLICEKEAVVGQWWVKTEFGGEKIAGPFSTADDAFTARTAIERFSKPQTFAVEGEGEI